MGSGASTGRAHNACALPCFKKGRVCPSPEFVNTTKRMSLHPYRNPDETHRVSTSEFPFYKPKVVTVRPRPTNTGNFQPINVMRNDDINNVHSNQFLLYNERFPIFNSDRKNDIFEPRGQRPCTRVNDRRWSASLQANINIPLQQGNVLVHKTVAQLRESNLSYPYGRSYSYTRDVQLDNRESSVNNGNRPPTPDQDWFPARRPSDYLIASSLLAFEQHRGRRIDHR